MFRHLPASAALALWFLASSATPVAAASTQLSAGQPFSEIYFSGTAPEISPDGLYAVYVQDATTNGAHELWSVPLAGGNPVRLSDVLVPGQSVKFAISPDSNRVVYLVDQDTAGIPELYSVPIAGGARTKLNMDLVDVPGQVRDFLISPTGQRVYYAADGEVNNVIELWKVDIDGGPSTRVNEEIASSYDVFEYAVGLTSGGAERVVYRVGRTVQGEHELWSVPANGSTGPIRISRGMVTGGGVDRYFQISPNGNRVLYLADATDNGSFSLYSVPIAGGTSTQLNGELDGAAGVKPDFVISPDSNTAVYRSDEGAETLLELYSVPMTGGIPTKLNPTPLAGGDVLEQAISPNGARVVYRADQELDSVNELYSVPIGGGIPTKLNGVLPTNGDVLDFAISPNSGRVVYRADQTTNDLNELWSVPLAGGANTRLNRTLTSAGDVQTFLISPNSQWVVYGADQDVDAVDRLLRVPIGGGTVEGVSSAPVPGGDIVLTFLTVPVFTISPTNSYDVLYAADEDLNDDVELYLSGAPEEEPADACVPDGLTLCLQNDKFDIRVTWHDFLDRTGPGQATILSNESGDFWFFNAQSNELIVKIINGCGSTGSYWVFWRALSNVGMDLVIRDTATLQTLTYHNPLGFNPNGHLDIDTIFRCDGTGPATETIDTSIDLPAPGVPQRIESLDPLQIGSCIPNGDRSICLQNGRFRVQGTWSDFSGGSGYAHLIKKNEGSGYAWFFNGNNYEMLFKLVDACSYNGNTWVSIAGLTNVTASLTITDTWTGTIYSQQNALGVDFPTSLDIETNLTYCGPHP